GWSGFTGDDQVLLHQFVLALDIVDVERDAVHRADLLALGFVVVADAFGAEVGVDDVDFLALGNGAVRALGLANVAVDAVIGDYQGHPASSSCGVYRSAGKTTGQFCRIGPVGARGCRQEVGGSALGGVPFVQRAHHRGVNELADVATEPGDLAYQRRGNIGELLRRGEEQAFHVRNQLAVHVGQLELVFEI